MKRKLKREKKRKINLKRHIKNHPYSYCFDLGGGKFLEFETPSKLTLRIFYSFLCLDSVDQAQILHEAKNDHVNPNRYQSLSVLKGYGQDEKEKLLNRLEDLIARDSNDIKIIAMALLNYRTIESIKPFDKWQILEIELIEGCNYEEN